MSNFWQRLIFGIIYVAALVGCVLWCKYSFLILGVIATGFMTGEFLRITMGTRYRYSQILTILAAVLTFALAWAVRAYPGLIHGKAAFLAFIPVMVVMVNSLYQKDKSSFGEFANIYTSLLYIAVPMASMNFLVMDNSGEYSGWVMIMFLLLIWASDVGAYVFGITLGQKFGKKLFPEISPKKSWIGFWGGLFCTIAVCLALYFTGVCAYVGLEKMTWYHAILLAIVIDVAGVYGDLFESQWKRYYAVKDSGTAIPGHGGFLDRLDSTLFAVPAGVIYLTIFNLF